MAQAQASFLFEVPTIPRQYGYTYTVLVSFIHLDGINISKCTGIHR
jgi:hypothetical protein